MWRTCLACALLALQAPASARGAQAPLLVFVAPADDTPTVGARLALERLKSGLEASLAPAPTAVLGVTRADAAPDPAPALALLADGQDAWLRTSFEEADQLLRDALGWALGHLPSIATSPATGTAFLTATVRLIQLDRLAGRDPARDDLVQRALAWWGELPLPDDEFPPDLSDEVRRLANGSACSGAVQWRALGPVTPGEALAIGGRWVELTGTGALNVPCGAWTVRRFGADGVASPWEWRVEVTAGGTTLVAVSPRFERALRLVSERSLEAVAYPELRDDLDSLARAHPVRALEVVLGPDDQPDVRDPNAGPAPLPRATALNVDMRTTPRAASAPWAPWALYGLSAAALATAITLNVLTNGWIDDQNAGEGARFDRIDQGRVGAWTCYGLAGASALAGAVWHLSTW